MLRMCKVVSVVLNRLHLLAKSVRNLLYLVNALLPIVPLSLIVISVFAIAVSVLVSKLNEIGSVVVR